MNSLLHWNGGQQNIAAQLLPFFPKERTRWVEPLVGAGSVWFQANPMHAVLCDKNPWLITVYREVRDHCEDVISALRSLPVNADTFHQIQQLNPCTVGDSITNAVNLIYLTQHSFGNSFRINKQGYFNLPYNHSTKHQFIDYCYLRTISLKLQYVKLYSGDFSLSAELAVPGDFFYFDPPHSEKRAFGYSSTHESCYEFTQKDYQRLLEVCHQLNRRNIRWAVSDHDTALLRLIFVNYKTVHVNEKNSLIVNY